MDVVPAVSTHSFLNISVCRMLPTGTNSDVTALTGRDLVGLVLAEEQT